MEEIRIKDITIQLDNSGLIITDSSKPGNSIVFDQVDLHEFIKFLISYRSAPTEKRNGFRIPIGSLSREARAKFGVFAEYAGMSVKTRVVDISLTGILIEDSTLRLPVDETISITLRYEDSTARISAVVVRCAGDLTSLHFPETIVSGELNPPESIMKLYMALVMDWLKDRVP